jgi:hypothetical protein
MAAALSKMGEYCKEMTEWVVYMTSRRVMHCNKKMLIDYSFAFQTKDSI